MKNSKISLAQIRKVTLKLDEMKLQKVKGGSIITDEIVAI